MNTEEPSTSTTGPGPMMPEGFPARFAMLDAVLLGLLALGTSLPFVSEADGSLWATDTKLAATVKFTAFLLAVVLLWGCLGTTESAASWIGGLQAAAAASMAGPIAADRPGLSDGGTLLIVVAVLGAAVGLVAVARSITRDSAAQASDLSSPSQGSDP